MDLRECGGSGRGSGSGGSTWVRRFGGFGNQECGYQRECPEVWRDFEPRRSS